MSFHKVMGLLMATAGLVWACGGCAAQAKPHGQDGDTVRTVYPSTGTGASAGVTYQPGVVGLALSLDAPGARVVRPREGNLDPSVGTLELWLSPKMPVNEMPDFGPVVSMVAEPFVQNIEGSMLLLLANSGTDSHGQLALGINPAAGKAASFVATQPLDWEVGSWHHVAVTWGPEGMTMGVDGRQVMATESTDGPRSPAETIGIGGHVSSGAWSQPCEFRIDELRISSTQRSLDEITASFTEGRAGRALVEDDATLLLEHFDGLPAPPARVASVWPANIMPPGAKPALRIVVPAVPGGEVALGWAATDLEGAVTASGGPTTLTASATEATEVELPLTGLGPGVHNVRVTSEDADGPAGATTVWVGAPPPEGLMDEASGFGQSGCFARDLGEDVFAAQRQMGVTWSRVSFLWSEIEPEQDRFEWAKYDEIVLLAEKYGVELVPTFMWEDPIPAWAGAQQVAVGDGIDNKRNLPPANLDDWRDYVTHVVTRYRDSVKWWIPWNEPNLSKYLGPERDPAKYVELLKAAAESIRAADADALVLGMSVSLVDLHFYEECFELGALDYCDAVGCHPYRMPVDPDVSSVGLNWILGLNEPRTWLEELQELEALIARYSGDRDLGIWLDEMGQPTEEDFVIPNVAVTEETAAIYLARMYAEGLGTQVVDKGLWFAFHGYGSFSLVRDDFTLKPEAVAYRLLAVALAGKEGVPDDAQVGETHAFRFEGGGGAWVTWTKEDAVDVTLDRVPPEARAYDIFARPVEVTLADGRATLVPGPTPTIVEW